MDQPPSPNRRVNREALSIHNLARRQPRKRILIEPLLWTRLHLDMLSCTFSQCSHAHPAMMHLPPMEKDDRRTVQDASRRRLFERAFSEQRGSWMAREGSIRCTLALEPSPLSWRRDLYLHLRGYPSILLPCHYYCLGEDVPVAAHVDRGRIMSEREKRIRPPLRRRNRPATSLAWLQLQMVTPVDPLHNPYLVALLIALGQLQWRALGERKTRQAAGVTPRLIYTTEDGPSICIYSVNMPSSLINMFDNPAMKPVAPELLAVKITMIPFKPVEAFFGRLLALLLSATSLEDMDKAENLIVYTTQYLYTIRDMPCFSRPRKARRATPVLASRHVMSCPSS